MKLSKNSLITAAVIVVVLYVLAMIVGLPGWVAILASVIVVVVLALVWKQPDVKPPPAPPPSPPPAPRVQEPVFPGPPSRTVSDIRLPSASADYQFSFAAVVQWSTVLPGTRHADLGSVAVDALLQRAKAKTATLQPGDESLNQHRLAALLGEPDLDEKGQVRMWATEVRLKLPDADMKHLAHVSALRRREQTSLLERRLEQGKRSYLKDDVLATPGSAVVWWLANNPGEVEKCVDLLDTLSRLSAAAQDRTNGHDPSTPGKFDFDGAVQMLLDGRTVEAMELMPAAPELDPSSNSTTETEPPAADDDERRTGDYREFFSD